MTKKNRPGAARAARAAQQAGAEAPYTELLRAAQAAADPQAVEPAPAPATPTTPAGGPLMPTPWSATTLVRIDDAYDTEYADRRGGSRYTAYVNQRRKEFVLWSDEDPDPVRFAAAAWRIATGPVMSPGYVRRRPDLRRVHTHRDDWAGDLVVAVEVPLTHNRLAGDRLPYAWGDWEAASHRIGDEDYSALEEPDAHRHQISVLTTSTVQILAKGWPLPTPTLAEIEGPGLAECARSAVQVLVEGINREAGPVVARLLGDQG
ncbi:hypothetical protein [Kitasatospora sp. NPDC085464]|uniref:hypothetical protein n=1 Tax=Kitasatospora sp. NPDC085464 TaxID=3364063 RepID=UPI0037C5DDD1